MDLASEQLDFERAGELRDVLHHLETMEEPTVVLEVEGGDRDVIGYARDGDDACVTVLRIRSGKLLSREQRFLTNIDGEEDADVMTMFLAGSYVGMQEKARQVLLPFDFPDRELIEQTLPDSKIQIPQRGPRRELITLAEQNARHLLEELKLSSMEAEERAGDWVWRGDDLVVGEKSGRRGDERLGDSRSDCAQGGGASIAKSLKGIDDAPHSSEESHKRRDCSRGGEPRKT